MNNVASPTSIKVICEYYLYLGDFLRIMKPIVFLFLIVFFVSCNQTFYTKGLVKRNEQKSALSYKYAVKDGYFEYVSNDFYTESKSKLIDSLRNYILDMDKKMKVSVLSNQELTKYNEIIDQLNDPKYTQYDSSKVYRIYFNEQIPGLKYEVIAVNYWNYSNVRFLFPFLLLGNRVHLRNQCINRAMRVCVKMEADGIIMNSNLSASKIFILVK